MQVTQPVAELCSLLVEEFYGELPSRIFLTLLTRGRLSLPHLAQFTAMSPRQLRHGLAVLLQHNLLYYHVDADTEMAMYQANPENSYNLIRNGKILEMVETSFGPAAKDVMQSLLLSGQTRVSDFVAAYQEKIEQAKKANTSEADDDDPFAEPNAVNGDTHATKKPGLVVKSTAQLNSVICRLVEAELIDVVHDKTFETAHDILKSVEREVMDTYFPNGVKGAKAKIEVEERIADGLRKIRSESKSLKRKLEQNGTAAKRRKLFMNGGVSNGIHEEDADPILDPKQVIRINYEKCLVDLRNRRLVQFVTDTIGETTAYVYGVLLKHLTKALPRCRINPLIDISEEHMEVGKGFVTTDEILDSLKTSVDLSLGLGKQTRDQFSSRAAERIYENPPKKKIILEADIDGDASADEDEEDDGDGSDSEGSMPDRDYKPDQTNGSKVKFADGAGGDYKLDRPGQLRQHLLLLAESSQRFVRHCGHNDWTVDFGPLMQVLKEAELDSVIEQQCGRPGLRLARILRDKGKLDEKAILTIALMRKNEIQQKMLQMQAAGFVHTQEVPRDTKADVKKSFFLWYSDVNRSLNGLLARSYESMLHCLQYLEVRRQKEKDVLMLTRRSDVRGREKDVMRKEYYDRYSRFLDHEKKLFSQIMRLDDLIALLKDF